ncbi:MAG: hypothetical protein ACJ749_17020, partial [Flavisolibacter sp.]
MKETIASGTVLLPVSINAALVNWGIAGGGEMAYEKLRSLQKHGNKISVRIIATVIDEKMKRLAESMPGVIVQEKEWEQ